MRDESGKIVLHVVESFGAGVASAVRSFLDATSDLEHHLLFARRSTEPLSPSALEGFRTAEELPSGLFASAVAVRRRFADLRPDVVHAHSSIAGALVRIALPRRSNTQVVYSPHCFSFERLDKTPIWRAIFRTIEIALASRTDAFALCSPHEVATVAKWRGTARIVLVPNRASVGTAQLDHVPSAGVAQIVTVGRLGIQKDPGYFLSVVTEMRRQREISATWIGGGDAAWEEELIAAGVRVTGWVDSPLVQEHLSRADLYVHSAQWEGFPIAIIDAAHTRTPAVCRRVSTLDFLDPELTAESPFDLAQLALSTLSDATANLNAWAATCRTQNAKYQREGLLEAYNVGKPHA